MVKRLFIPKDIINIIIEYTKINCNTCNRKNIINIHTGTWNKNYNNYSDSDDDGIINVCTRCIHTIQPYNEFRGRIAVTYKPTATASKKRRILLDL